METSVLQRIREIIDYYSLSDRKFAESIGFPQTTISSLFQRGNEPNVSIVQAILNTYTEISPDWLLTGNSSTFIDPAKRSKASMQTRPRIPLTAAAGSLSGLSTSVTLEQCEQSPIIHQLPSYDFTMFIKGDSMAPKYESGDEVACRKIDQSRFVQWGKPHVLDTTQGIIIKRVYEDGNKLRCVSYNPDYADFSVPKEDVYSMSLVVGSLNISEM